MDQSRRLFVKTFAFSVGGAALALRSRRLALAQEEPRGPSLLLTQDPAAFAVSDNIPISPKSRTGYPSIAWADGKVWAAWVEEEGKKGKILLRGFDPETESWSDETPVATEALYLTPQAVAAGEGVVIVWSEKRGGSWGIQARRYDPVAGSLGPVVDVSGPSHDGDLAWNPTAVPVGRRIAVTWEAKPEGASHFAVFRRLLREDGQPDGRVFDLRERFPDTDCRRPALASHPQAGVVLVFDACGESADTNILLARLQPDLAPEDGEFIPVSRHPAGDLAPAVAFGPEGDLVWIAWHSNRRGEAEWDIPRWFELRAWSIRKNRLLAPVSEPLHKNLDKRDTDQGFEFVRLVAAPDGKVCILGRPSHNFCLQWHQGNEWSPIHRFPKDGWGGRGCHVSALIDPTGTLWVARRDLNICVLQKIEGFVGDAVAPELVEVPSEGRLPAAASTNRSPHIEFPPQMVSGEGREEERYQFFFGDIHAHSWMSDGMGDVDEFYIRSRDLLGDDFGCLTDHDSFVGKRMLDAEWEVQKAIASHYHEPGRHVTFYGQEWTTARTGRPNGFGHKCLIAVSPDVPLFDHTAEGANRPEVLFPRLRELGVIAIPHHIGWTGVDWENHDPEVQPLVEICSVHGAFEYMGNEPIPHRGGMKGCFVQDGLARGLRFGICGGSDQHGLIWHHRVCWKRDVYRAGLTGVLATERTREAIFDAMQRRRTFATTGAKLRPEFTIDGRIMGEEFEAGRPPVIAVDVTSPVELKWIVLVRNNQDLLRYGGEGYRSRFTYTDRDIPAGRTSWYYLRIVLEDGNMAWTSPIWVKPTA